MVKELILDVRSMGPGDSHRLIDIDLKVSEFPWAIGKWYNLQWTSEDWDITVATLNNTPVGFSIIESLVDIDICRIHRLVVLNLAQRIGLNNMLLDRAQYAAVIRGLTIIEFMVSEVSCRGMNDPYDLSVWLLKQSFKCEKIEKERFEAYGKKYDGYLFRKTLHYG